jgi:hypothetical protein
LLQSGLINRQQMRRTRAIPAQIGPDAAGGRNRMVSMI